MTKWYEIIGNAIEMNIDGQWIHGYVTDGYRYKDGIITMQADNDKQYWCGVESGTYRKANDSRDDLMTYAEKIHTIAEHYGLEPQMRMLQEECAELIQAVNKYFRKGNKDGKEAMNLAEEIADVIIMCQQIQHLLDCGDIVHEVAGEKLDRQIERIGNEKSKTRFKAFTADEIPYQGDNMGARD